jgi:acetolactate synthase-1/2/3 large subunit
MGVGLSAAIGCSIANPKSIIYHFEGDGGFAQNIQELGTISIHKLPIKIFLFSNGGFASIRKTQKKYFDGSYIGCDEKTGLGLPNWEKLFTAFGIKSYRIHSLDQLKSVGFESALTSRDSCAWIVEIDPDLDYLPAVSTIMKSDGQMESAPLSQMTTNLSEDILKRVFKYI